MDLAEAITSNLLVTMGGMCGLSGKLPEHRQGLFALISPRCDEKVFTDSLTRLEWHELTDELCTIRNNEGRTLLYKAVDCDCVVIVGRLLSLYDTQYVDQLPAAVTDDVYAFRSRKMETLLTASRLKVRVKGNTSLGAMSLPTKHQGTFDTPQRPHQIQDSLGLGSDIYLAPYGQGSHRKQVFRRL
jgi:hypothetical protein